MKKKLKVVYIISHLGSGGAQVLIFDILSYMKSKYEIDIIVITIDSGEYANKFIDAGIKVIDLEEKGLINVKIFLKLKKLLKKLKPDIVHTHLNKGDFYGRIAARRSGVPFIYSTCHNYSTHHKGADISKQSIFDRIDNLVISYSKSNLIAISEIVRKYLIMRNAKHASITDVIYNGVSIEKEKYKLSDKEIVNFRDRFNISKDDFVILILGRLDPQKGHNFFLDAVKDYLKEKKNIKILILGEGKQRKLIENIVNENSLNEYVRLLGFLQETEEFIEISDIICVPSLWEGFGLVIIEGMIKKKIVLASDVGGIPEIIEDGKTGFLFEVENKNNFLEKIKFIYDNYTSLDYIKENALKLVKDKFDIQKTSELYHKAYLRKLNNIEC